MIDVIAEGDLRSAAVAHCRGLVGAKRRVRDRDVPVPDFAAVSEAVEAAMRARRRRPAVQSAIDLLLKAATQAIDVARADARAVFQRLRLPRNEAALLIDEGVALAQPSGPGFVRGPLCAELDEGNAR